MVRGVHRFLLLAVLAAAAAVPMGSAHAVDDARVLLENAGPGFERVEDQAGDLGTVTRTFVHPDGELQLQLIPLSEGIDARQLFVLLEEIRFDAPGIGRIDIPGLPLARWMGVEGVAPERSPVLFVAFASRSSLFSALLTTNDLESLPPVVTLLDVARRQIERAGGAPRAPRSRLLLPIPSWRRCCQVSPPPSSG